MPKAFMIDTKKRRATFVREMLDTKKIKYITLPETNHTIAVLQFADGWSVQAGPKYGKPLDFDKELYRVSALENCFEKAEAHYWNVASYLNVIGMTSIVVPMEYVQVNLPYEQ